MKRLFVLLMSMLLFSGCTEVSKPTYEKYSMTATDLGFDTVISLIAYCESEEEFNEYTALLREGFTYYDQLFDKYDTYDGVNNIKTINDQAGIAPVKVDSDIIEMLQLSLTYDEISDQAFDITMGSVLNIWHDYREQGILDMQEGKETKIPSMDILKEAKKSAGTSHLIIDEENSTVYIDDANTSIDVGGVAKGFAVKKVKEELVAAGCQHAIINAGGNIQLIGSKPNAENWSVGVQIPNSEANTTDSLVSIRLDKDMSIVTSGDYNRYYLYHNERMHHIIDPDTLMPANHCRSVTVLCEDSGIADIVSTTLFTMSHEEGIAFLDKLKQEEGISVEAMWVYDEEVPAEDDHESITIKDYEVVITDGLKDIITYE